MKGVCAPGHIVRTRNAGRGAAAMRSPLLFIGALSFQVRGAGANRPCLPSFSGKIVHSSSKSDENACKTPDIG